MITKVQFSRIVLKTYRLFSRNQKHRIQVHFSNVRIHKMDSLKTPTSNTEWIWCLKYISLIQPDILISCVVSSTLFSSPLHTILYGAKHIYCCNIYLQNLWHHSPLIFALKIDLDYPASAAAVTNVSNNLSCRTTTFIIGFQGHFLDTCRSLFQWPGHQSKEACHIECHINNSCKSTLTDDGSKFKHFIKNIEISDDSFKISRNVIKMQLNLLVNASIDL